MSKHLDKATSCDGKIKYDSKEDANINAISAKNKSNVKSEMSSYKCIHCGKYHVGRSGKNTAIKQPNKQRRQKKKLNPLDFDVHLGRDKGFYTINQFYLS